MKAQRTRTTTHAVTPEAASPIEAPAKAAGRPAARQGKKAVSAYFSPEVSRALNMLAVEHETTLQALMGEAIDLLMRQYDKHPFGER
jgi:hypothetical protein